MQFLQQTLRSRGGLFPAPSVALLILMLLLALLLSACGAAGGAAASNTPQATLPPATPPTSAIPGGPPTVTPPAAAANCAQVPGFANAGAASAGTVFSDIIFPANSIGFTMQTPEDHSYLFQLIAICTPGMKASDVTNAIANNLLGNGWVQSAGYPYHGNPAANCNDANCWHKDFRYIALEGASTAGSVAVYTLRLAITPYSQTQSVSQGAGVPLEPENGNDLTWSGGQISPSGTATLVNIGVTNFDSVTLSQLQSLRYSTLPLAGGASNALVTGDVFAVHDQAGHYSKVQVVSYGSTLQLKWVVYRATF